MFQSGVVGKHTRWGIMRFESSKEQSLIGVPESIKRKKGDLKVERRNLPAATVRAEHFGYFRFLKTQNSGLQPLAQKTLGRE